MIRFNRKDFRINDNKTNIKKRKNKFLKQILFCYFVIIFSTLLAFLIVYIPGVMPFLTTGFTDKYLGIDVVFGIYEFVLVYIVLILTAASLSMHKHHDIEKTYLWWIWNVSGGRFILSKLIPERNDNGNNIKPSTYFLWLIGLYFAIYGFASQRYTSQLATLESKRNLIYFQLSSNNIKRRKLALENIAKLQKYKIHLEPNIWEPISVFKSLCLTKMDERFSDELKNIVFLFIEDINDVRLSDINLSNHHFENLYMVSNRWETAELSSTYWLSCNLTGSHYRSSKLDGAVFYCSNLKDSIFSNCNLYNTFFIQNNMQDVTIQTSNLEKTEFIQCLLTGKFCNNIKNIEKAIFKETYYVYIPNEDKEKIVKNINARKDENIKLLIGMDNTIFPDDYAPKANRGLINLWFFYKKNKKLPDVVKKILKMNNYKLNNRKINSNDWENIFMLKKFF